MNPNMADFGGIPRLRTGHFAIKAQRRKAARLRKLRRRFIRPRRRGAAIPPALHSLPLGFESQREIFQKENSPPFG